MADRQKLVTLTIKAFKELQGCDEDLTLTHIEEISYQAASLLRTIYTVELLGVKFTRTEREIIGPLVKSALFAIENWIDLSADSFPPHYNLAHSKRERSGLQFLLDNYADFPTGESETVADLLGNLRETTDLEGWDKRLHRAPFSVNFDIVEFDIPDQEKLRLPRTHWWCFE